MCLSRYVSAEAFTAGVNPTLLKTCLLLGKRATGPSTNTVASAVSSPTPECVMRRWAAGSAAAGSDQKIEFVDMAVQPLQQLETVIAAPARVRQPHEGLQFGRALARPKRGPEGQPLIQGDHVQTIRNLAVSLSCHARPQTERGIDVPRPH